jgi:hypothetical protein
MDFRLSGMHAMKGESQVVIVFDNYVDDESNQRDIHIHFHS